MVSRRVIRWVGSFLSLPTIDKFIQKLRISTFPNGNIIDNEKDSYVILIDLPSTPVFTDNYAVGGVRIDHAFPVNLPAVMKLPLLTDIPILDDEYWTALEILADEVGCVKDCCAQGLAWYPADSGQFDWALRTYRNWHPEDGETYLLAFPWPETSEVPSIPDRYFVPTEKEKAKIQWFIENLLEKTIPG